ncbi:MAG: methyltransferase domain-containing protein [Proteobacteria bacterium]|nr:methyltransferase domain-containing protein [Pseudomonadota bacterium]
MWADQALARFIRYADVHTVIDIGAGDNQHAQILRDAGKEVTTISLRPPANLVADYMQTALGPVDGIWASHVLEHMPNVGVFLEKCFADLHDGGVLAITVPPAKHNLVGGHVSLWNEGLLLYRLILAGFDCREARVGVYGYNLSVIVRKVKADLPPLAMDNGDIERLARFFPFSVEQGIDGRCGNIRWSE